MYQTSNFIAVKIIHESTVFEFADAPESPGLGTAVLNQVLAGRDVEGYVFEDIDKVNVIIPYHAIEYVVVESERNDVGTLEDDNCKTGDEEGDDSESG